MHFDLSRPGGTSVRTDPDDAVLIIEDDPAIATLEQHVLVKAGFAVHIAGTVTLALDMLRVRGFAAILLDYQLPDADPWAVVDAAAARLPKIPVVLITGQGSEQLASEAIHRGVADYVQKTHGFGQRLPTILQRVLRLSHAEERLRRTDEFFERTHLASAVRMPDGTFERVNASFAAMHGYAPEELVGRPVETVVAPHKRRELPGVFAAISRDRGLRAEFEHIRKDGTIFPVIVDATAVHDSDGRFLYGAVYVQDVTEQRVAERALRSSEERARAVRDAIPDTMFRFDAKGVCLDYHPQEDDVLGMRADLIGKHARERLPPGLASQLLEHLKKALETRKVQTFEAQVDTSLGVLDYELRLMACGEDDVVAIARDITAAKQGSRQLQASLREKEVLLQEIHHRVKNNLQLISSLMNMQARQLPAAERAVFAECQTRVHSIALIHEQLYRSHDYSRVAFSEYVRKLAESVFRVSGISDDMIALKTEIEDIWIGVDKAIPCGLILNELITNAVKHAFPAGRHGTIRVEMRRLDRSRVRLAVHDDGVGVPEDFAVERTESLGLKLITTLAEQLDAQFEVTRNGGSTFQVTVPLPT